MLERVGSYIANLRRTVVTRAFGGQSEEPEVTSALKRYTRPVFFEDQAKVLVALAGAHGVGKSSLVNSLLQLGPQNVDAADVGIGGVTEETFCFENETFFRNLVFCDLPGGVLSGDGPNDYYRRHRLDDFTIILLVFKGQITEDELSLARLCKSRGRTLVFVRSRCDLDLKNLRADRMITSTGPEAALKFIKTERTNFRNYIQQFADVVADVKLFMVSARSMYNETTRLQFFRVYSFQEKELISELTEYCSTEAASASKPIAPKSICLLGKHKEGTCHERKHNFLTKIALKEHKKENMCDGMEVLEQRERQQADGSNDDKLAKSADLRNHSDQTPVVDFVVFPEEVDR